MQSSFRFLVAVCFYLSSTILRSRNWCVRTATDRPQAMVNVLYWDLPPLITTRSENAAEGFIPQTFHQADILCADVEAKYKRNGLEVASYRPLSSSLSFKAENNSLENFNALLYSNLTNEEILPNGVSVDTAFFAPYILSESEEEHRMLERRGLVATKLYTSLELVIVVNRASIAIFQKIMNTIKIIAICITYAVILAWIIGIFLWLLERRTNPLLRSRAGAGSGSFLHGSGTCIWFSFVTMATVGYGDIFPVTFTGRVVTVTWIMIGLSISALMTGVLTDGVNNKSVDLTDQTISVLENTTAARVAGSDLQGVVVPQRSYVEMLHTVRRGEVFAALASSDIVASHGDQFETGVYSERLSVVSTIRAQQHYHYLVFKEPWSPLRDVMQCIQDDYTGHQGYAMTKTRRFNKHVIVDHPSIREMVLYDLKTQILVFIMIGLVMVVFLVEIFVVQRTTLSSKKKPGCSDDGGVGKLQLTERGVTDSTIKEIIRIEMLKLKMRLSRQQEAQEKTM